MSRQLLKDIVKHLKVDTTVTPEQLRDFVRKTDVHDLTDRMDEFTDEQKLASAERESEAKTA